MTVYKIGYLPDISEKLEEFIKKNVKPVMKSLEEESLIYNVMDIILKCSHFEKDIEYLKGINVPYIEF